MFGEHFATKLGYTHHLCVLLLQVGMCADVG
jgi:hypothetical protein